MKKITTNTTKIKRKFKSGFSFLTLFMLFGTLYLGVSASFNIMKCVNYKIKLSELQTLYNEAKIEKANLQAEIDSYSSPEANEKFLRNNLKYAAGDEIELNLVEDE